MRQAIRAGVVLGVTPDNLAAWNQLHAEEVVVENMNRTRLSLARFLEGAAEDIDLARLGGEVNTCYIALAASAIDGRELVMQRLEAAATALEEARGIKEKHGRYGLTGPGRLALGEGVDAIELTLRATTPRQMSEAELQLRHRLQQMERKP